MSAASGLRPTGLLAIARRFVWEHPEWWVIGLACLAWLPMLAHGVDHAGHALHVMPPVAELTHWLLMIAAMMFPLALDPLRNVAFRSYRRRRHLAMVELLVGYLGVWALAGLPVIALRASPWGRGDAIASGLFVLAGVWSLSRLRRRALTMCHASRPLAPSGWRATRDTIRYGALLGAWCVVACWPLMLACTVTGHALVAMVGGATIGWQERRSFRPPIRRVALLTFALAAWFGGAAVVDAMHRGGPSAVPPPCHAEPAAAR